MTRDRLYFLLLNIGHFLDHFVMLVFGTVAALVLIRDWDMSYADLLTYATPGFFAFGLFSLPAGWIADRWSRDGMMVVFFVGIGVTSILTGFARTPVEIGAGLFFIGMFAAIYHPVGLAIVSLRWRNMGTRIAVNGVWGNLGVACAALTTGYLIDTQGWRAAYVLPGILSVGMGGAYLALRWANITGGGIAPIPQGTDPSRKQASNRGLLLRVSGIIFLTTAVASVVFQSTTFALPKIFDERLGGLTGWVETALNSDRATIVGALAFVVFAVASMAQLVVGRALDIHGPRRVFMVVALIEVVFFSMMPGQSDGVALAIAFGFMFGAFGQIPINDFMIGKMASGPARARIFGIRYVIGFTALAASLPLIAVIHENWGFDRLFLVLAGAGAILFFAAYCLPRRLPSAEVVASE